MKKWLSIVLVLALLGSALLSGFAEPGEAFPPEAEEAEPGELYLEAEEDGEETFADVEVAALEDEETPGTEGSVETSAVEVEASGDVAVASEADVSLLEAVGMEDAWRYARVTAETATVYGNGDCNTVLTTLKKGDILLITRADDRVADVAFDTAKGIQEGCALLADLQYADLRNSEAFLEMLVEQGEVSAYQNDRDYLLPRLSCMDEEPKAEETTLVDNHEDDVVIEAPADTTEDEPVAGADDSPVAEGEAREEDPELPVSDEPSGQEPGEGTGKTDGEDAPVVGAEGGEPAGKSGEVDPAADGEGEDPSAAPEGEGEPGEAEDPGEGEPEGEGEEVEVPEVAEAAASPTPIPTPTPAPKPASNAIVAPASIRTGASQYTIGLGESGKIIETIFTPANATSTLAWKSSNAKVVTINKKTGKLKAIKKGKATITIQTANGKKATCKVVVANAPTKVAVSPAAVTLWAKQTRQLAVAVNKNAGCGKYTFASSNTAVAMVNGKGLVTAVGRGTAKITVKTYNKQSAIMTVTVNALPVSVAFERTQVDAYAGLKVKLTAKAYDGAAGRGVVTPSPITYSVVSGVDPAESDPSCISLAADGTVTALKEGVARVRAVAHNGVVSMEDCVIRVLPEADGVALNLENIEVGVGETYRGLRFTVEEGRAASIERWWSDDAATAKVDANGAVTGVKAGETRVWAQPHKGEAVACEVRVKPAPTKLTLSPASREVTTLDPVEIHAAVNEGSVCNGFTYDYADAASKGVASLNRDTGVVTPLHSGTAKVDVKAYNGVHQVFTLTVILPPDSVSVTNAAAAASIFAYQSVALKAVVLDAKGAVTKGTASFTSAAPTPAGIVSVSAGGVVTGLNPGKATVHVTCGEIVEDVDITVRPAPKRIILSPERKTIGKGETLDLRPALLDASNHALKLPYTITTTKAGKKILALNANGTVRAKKKGKAVVTVRHANGVSAQVTITVNKAPGSVKLTPKTTTLGVGQVKQLKVTLPKNTAGKCTFSSSKKSVAIVNPSTGLVKAVGVGTATITVKTFNKKKAKVKVKVTRAPSYLVLTGPGITEQLSGTGKGAYVTGYSLILRKGKAYQITGRVEYPTRGNVESYRSVDPSVASVSGSGRILALRPGTSVIRVTATGGAYVDLTVFVYGEGTAPGKSLGFDASEMTVAVGESAVVPALKASGITDNQLRDVTLKSGDASRVSVARNDGDWLWSVRGVAVGEAVVTATAGGVTAALKVKVTAAGEDPGQVEDSGIRFVNAGISMTVGDSLLPTVVDDAGNEVSSGVDEEGEPIRLSLSSDDADVVAVAADGLTLDAVGSGTARITAAYGAARAYANVTVKPRDVSLKLSATQKSLYVGERFQLTATTNASRVTFESNDTKVARVSSTGVVTARSAGQADIIVNADGRIAECSVTVLRHISQLSISPAASVTGKVGATLTFTVQAGAPDETGSVTFSLSDGKVAALSTGKQALSGGRASCKVRLKKTGTTLLTATADTGYSVTVPITVTDPNQVTYRLFTACGFAMPSYTGKDKMPFPKHNTLALRKILGESGMNYSMNTNLVNPTVSKLRSSLQSFLSKADSNDVTVVYLVTHGLAKAADNRSGYYMVYPVATSGGVKFERLTSDMIMSALLGAKGKVVLLLDSCYSGAFLGDQTSALNGAGGRISVITASNNTRSSFYNVPNTNKAMDFYTFFILMGMGYDSINSVYIKDEKRTKGSAPGYMLADSYEDFTKKDGVITLGELFDFARKSILANIPSYSKKSWFWGHPKGKQSPQSYLGSNASLALYKPKG